MAESVFGDALSPSERRTSDRKKLIVGVRYAGGDATGIANTRDIGIGGLYIMTNADFNTGDELMMSFELNGKSLDLAGVVAYVDPQEGIGIRFRELDADAENFLREQLDLV